MLPEPQMPKETGSMGILCILQMNVSNYNKDQCLNRSPDKNWEQEVENVYKNIFGQSVCVEKLHLSGVSVSIKIFALSQILYYLQGGGLVIVWIPILQRAAAQIIWPLHPDFDSRPPGVQVHWPIGFGPITNSNFIHCNPPILKLLPLVSVQTAI